MTEIIKTIQHAASSINPFETQTFKSMGGVDYIIGSLFILIGLLIYVLFNRKSKTRLAEYKKEQLALYNKNRRTNVSDYSRTGLYVPFWERVKHSSPIMLTVLFILMGITWIVWTATGAPLIGSL